MVTLNYAGVSLAGSCSEAFELQVGRDGRLLSEFWPNKKEEEGTPQTIFVALCFPLRPREMRRELGRVRD